jgi:hypothetical protein
VQFPFLDDGADPEIAREALSALISKVVEEPQIDQALRLATEQFDIVEQERLRKRKENINERFRLVRAQTND